jgi:hypothetical protein
MLLLFVEKSIKIQWGRNLNNLNILIIETGFMLWCHVMYSCFLKNRIVVHTFFCVFCLHVKN